MCLYAWALLGIIALAVAALHVNLRESQKLRRAIDLLPKSCDQCGCDLLLDPQIQESLSEIQPRGRLNLPKVSLARHRSGKP